MGRSPSHRKARILQHDQMTDRLIKEAGMAKLRLVLFTIFFVKSSSSAFFRLSHQVIIHPSEIKTCPTVCSFKKTSQWKKSKVFG